MGAFSIKIKYTSQMDSTTDIKKIILAEDESLLVIDKPSGLVVNKSQTQREITLQELVHEYLKLAPNDLGVGERSGIVHRLDKDTSGLILIAKTKNMFEYLQERFKNHQIKKTYLALLHGKMVEDMVTVDAPIGRNPKNRLKFAIVEGARDAKTEFVLLNRYSRKLGNEYNYYSYVSVLPQSGRTHQIRVHSASLNQPVVSDPIYLGRRRLKDDLKMCPRLFLHASEISFSDPKTSETRQFRSVLPTNLQNVLNKLDKG